MKSQHWNAKQKQNSFQCLCSEIARIFLIYCKESGGESEKEVMESSSTFLFHQKSVRKQFLSRNPKYTQINQCWKKGIVKITTAINRRIEFRKIERESNWKALNERKNNWISFRQNYGNVIDENEGKYCGGNRKQIVHMCEYILVVLNLISIDTKANCTVFDFDELLWKKKNKSEWNWKIFS